MSLSDITVTGKKATRDGFGDGLMAAGQANDQVVALCADLIGSLKMDAFIEADPERFIQVGIAEANMMGIAAGLATTGKIPYTGTFANFSTGRVYDQIRQSIAYSHKNVKVCASHAGLTLGEDGATHQILEDIGMMKMLPGFTVINTCDYAQTKAAAIAIAEHYGPVYLRFGRPNVVRDLRGVDDPLAGRRVAIVIALVTQPTEVEVAMASPEGDAQPSVVEEDGGRPDRRHTSSIVEVATTAAPISPRSHICPRMGRRPVREA